MNAGPQNHEIQHNCFKPLCFRETSHNRGFPGGPSGKELACQCRRHETWVGSLGREDPLEKGMATHSSILAWRILWTEELGGLHSWDRKESDTTEATLHAHKHSREPCILLLSGGSDLSTLNPSPEWTLAAE